MFTSNSEEVSSPNWPTIGSCQVTVDPASLNSLSSSIAGDSLKSEIFDLAWQFINKLGDKSYYAIHIRRNDFQYKDLFITCEDILNNIKDIIQRVCTGNI